MTTVFASRWKALAWSAGVLLTAYCTVPAADESTKPDAQAEQAAQTNPWALDKPRS